jgi:hypothetical protein
MKKFLCAFVVLLMSAFAVISAQRALFGYGAEFTASTSPATNTVNTTSGVSVEYVYNLRIYNTGTNDLYFLPNVDYSTFTSRVAAGTAMVCPADAAYDIWLSEGAPAKQIKHILYRTQAGSSDIIITGH